MAEFGFFSVSLTVTVSLLLMISHGAENVSVPCPIKARINLTGEYLGDLGTVEKSGYVFPPESITRQQDGGIYGCICHQKACLPLCSGPRDASANFPMVFKPDLTLDEVLVNHENFHFIVSKPCDRDFYPLEPDHPSGDYPDDRFYLLKNGSLYLPLKPNITDHMYTIQEYCFWRTMNETSRSYDPVVCLGEDQPVGLQYTIPFIEMVISIPFLLITLIVYCVLPEMKNVHGFTIRGYVGCLLVGYTCRAVTQDTNISEIPCTIAAHTHLFSLLASLSWLNVMGYDIWRTFGRSFLLQIRSQQSERKRCLIYSIYAWGFAIFFTAICVAMNHLMEISDSVFSPQFVGEDRCWFQNRRAELVYLSGPMCIVLLSNTFFFVSTAVKLCKDSEDNAWHLRGRDSEQHYNNHRQMWHLYIKLFIVLGISWIIEVIVILCDEHSTGVVWVEIINSVNSLRGPILFVVFICKKKILRFLINRFRSQSPNSNSRKTSVVTYSTSNRSTSSRKMSMAFLSPSDPSP